MSLTPEPNEPSESPEPSEDSKSSEPVPPSEPAKPSESPKSSESSKSSKWSGTPTYLFNNYQKSESGENKIELKILNEIKSTSSKAVLGPGDFEKEEFDSSDTKIFDEEKIETIVRNLEETNLLLIKGEPLVGKFTASLKVGSLLQKKGTINKMFSIDSVPKNIHIKIDSLIEENKEVWDGALIIFKDVFDKQNDNLIDFFERLNFESFKRKLQTNKCYLIFTDSSTNNYNIHPKIKFTFDNLPALVLEKLIYHYLDTNLLSIRENNVKEKIKNLFNDNKVHVIQQKIGRIGLIERFFTNLFKNYQDDLIKDDAQQFLTVQINNFNTTKEWFLKEIGDSDEKLFWILPLVLVQCTKEIADIRYGFVHELRKNIISHFKSNRAERETLLNDKKEHSYYSLFHVENKEYTLQFEKDIDKEAIWNILHKNYKYYLFEIFSLVKSSSLNEEDYTKSYYYNCIIGRFADKYPDEVREFIFDLIYSSDNDYYTRGKAIGFIFLGIFSCENEQLTNLFLSYLHDELKGNKINVLRSLLIAIGIIGRYKLEWVLKEIEKLILNRFGDRIEKYVKFGNRSVNLESEVIKFLYDEFIKEFFLEEDDSETYQFIVNAINTLCFFTDVTAVFREITRWLTAKDKSPRIICTYLFLNEGGIADSLKFNPIYVNWSEVSNSPIKLHPIVDSLFNEDKSVEEVGEFLLLIFESINLILNTHRPFIRKRFINHLDALAENSTKIPVKYNPIVKLFLMLMRKSDDLSIQIERLMDKYKRGNNDKLIEFRNKVMRQIKDDLPFTR